METKRIQSRLSWGRHPLPIILMLIWFPVSLIRMAIGDEPPSLRHLPHWLQLPLFWVIFVSACLVLFSALAQRRWVIAAVYTELVGWAMAGAILIPSAVEVLLSERGWINDGLNVLIFTVAAASVVRVVQMVLIVRSWHE